MAVSSASDGPDIEYHEIPAVVPFQTENDCPSAIEIFPKTIVPRQSRSSHVVNCVPFEEQMDIAGVDPAARGPPVFHLGVH